MAVDKPPPTQKRLLSVVQKLSAPSDVVDDPDQRLLSHILSSSLLVVLLLLIILFVIRQPFGVAVKNEILIRVTLGIAVAIGYFLSRAGHYRAAARLMIIISLIALFALALTGDLNSLDYLSVVVLFGSLFLSLAETIAIALFTLLALAAFPILAADSSLPEIIDGPLSLNATLIAIALLITAYRSYLENTRRNQLEHTKRHYQTIADSAYDWIYWEGSDGSYQYVSPSCERILGYTVEDWMTNPDLLIERIHPEDKNKWIEHRKQATASPGLHEIQFRILHKDGSAHWIEHVCQPIQDKNEGFMGFRASNRDITDRLQAQEQLQSLSTAVEQSPSSVVITDTAGRIKYVNPKFAEVTGYQLEEVLGHNPRLLQSGLTPTETYNNMWDALKAGHEWHGEFANKKKNGEIYWESASISPVKNDQGVITHYVSVKEDITRRKQVEKELQTYRDQLEELVRKRTIELTQTNKRLLQEIDERKRVQEELLHSEQFAHSVLNGLSAHIAIVDEHGEIIAVNQPWRDFALANPPVKTNVNEGANYLEVCEAVQGRNRPDARAFARGIRAVLTGQTGEFTLEYDCHSPQEQRWFIGRVTPFPGSNSPQVVIAHENITQRKQAELALEQRAGQLVLINRISRQIASYLNLETILETLARLVQENFVYPYVSIFTFDRTRTRLELRASAGDLASTFPSDHELALGEGLVGWVAQDGERILVNDVQQEPRYYNPLPTQVIRSELAIPICIAEKVVGIIDIQSEKVNAFDDSDVLVIETLADTLAVAIQNARLYQELEEYSSILEQAVEERTSELQQAKERVEAIFNNTPDSILFLKPDGTLQSENMSFSRLFGYDVGELHGQRPHVLFESEKEFPCEEMFQVVVTTHETVRGELLARRKNGTTFDADMALAPIKEGDKLVGLVCTLRDISTLKEVERMKDGFVSNVSHELRTPITSLKLNHRLINIDPDRQAVYIERIGREIRRLNELIEDLLRLSRLDQGRVELDFELVSLNTIANQYVHDRAPLAEDRGLKLTFDETAAELSAQADQGLLGQALSVLLTNALNYTPSGGAITVSTLTGQKESLTWAGISVQDTGPGITPEDQSHLFERFFRGKAGRESGAPGTGLGLAIAHEIMQRHNGYIEIDSQSIPGQGATFTLWLPVENNAPD